MNVLAYGFEAKAEIGWFRMRDPLRVMHEQGRVEVRSTPDMQWPKIVPHPLLRLDQLRANTAKVEEDAEWADILFTERYLAARDVQGLAPIVERQNLPWILDVDDHILELDPEKEKYGAYTNTKHPSEWGEAREISDPSEVQEGEVCMKHSTGKLLAVKPKKDYVHGLSQAQIIHADAIICGTKELAFIYGNLRRQAGQSGPTFYIPYSVDPRRWDDLQPRHDHPGEVWMGWLGADEHEKDLRFILPAIEHALGTYPNLRFFWKRANVREFERLALEYPERCIKFNRWVSREQWPDYCSLSSFDIMLAPLVSTPFNDARSPMKWVEAAMLKVPCICSRTWGYQEVVKNRATGYLCSRPKQWIRAIDELVRSDRLRQDMGLAAYESAMDTHNLLKNAELYEAAFNVVIEGKR